MGRLVSARSANQVGEFIIPARARVHLLHGDLRQMVEDAGAYCRRSLNDSRSWTPDQAVTKKRYEVVVRFAEAFRRGGTHEISVWAYARSNTVTIQVAASDDR